MIQEQLYNVKDPPWEKDPKEREKREKQSKSFWVNIISKLNFLELEVYLYQYP